MVSRLQGPRMDEQRCSAPQIFLAPGSPPAPRKAHSRPASPTATPSSQRPPGSASLSPTPDKERVQRDGLHTAQQGVAPGTVEQEQFFSMLSHVQRGRMEEQRCVFDPNKRSACTPKHPNTTKSVPTQSSMADIDQLFSILASTQSHRLDDQRVSLNLLPGLQGVSGSDQEGRGKSVAGKETDELCNMVSRLQGPRMDEQRCSAPQIFLAPGSPPAPRKAHSRPASPTATPSSQRPPGSASLSPTPDKERVQRDGLHTAQQGVAPGTVEQEQFFSMLSHVQRGRMEEQRCVFDPNKRSACTPKHPNTTKSVPTQSSMADIDQLFSILASTQSHRLDDQRVSLNLLPGLQGVSGSDQEGRGKSVAGKETDELCNMVSRLQGPRMDEQRCSAPQIFLAPGSPPAPRKAHSRPASPTATPSSQRPPGSASLSPTPDKERVQRDGLHTAQGVAPGTVEQEQFFSMLSHVQRGRMEEQRCVFDPNKRSACTPKHPNTTKSVPTQSSMADIDQLFSILASTQSHRLDDQRVSLNLLPGLQGVSGSDQEGRGKSVAGKETDELCNMVSRLQGCRIEEQRCSLPVALSPGPPRSASMSTVTLESTLHRQDQLLSAPNPAPPRKARSNPSSPSRATPKKSRSRPNSPSRATPRKSRSRPNSPSRATPRKSRSRPNSPSRATPRKSRSRPQSPNAAQHVSSPIGPEDDCFSLIHRVHAAQLHRAGDAGAHGREGGKPERGGEKRAGGEGGKREGKTAGAVQKERRGKEEVRKEKKGGGKNK
ncbi:uncharacterized protein C6orf132 isoform X1 [Anguilla rostrata]|uniref:uncharacterized protein C6orf132 isoform X1 n=1 Tax=Anguilla rostrata TaxID=7938 RepID=UPI0030D2F807